MTGRTGATLKISVQRDYNTFLYGALPLCVVLAHDMSPWFLERYVQVYSCYCSEYEWPELDMCDSFAYPEVLDTVTLDRQSLAAADIVQLIRTAINEGSYATVFLDTNYLVGDTSAVFVHECLVYGYDDAARHVMIVGFAADLRFTAQRIDYDTFSTAFNRALVASAPGGQFQFLGFLVQLLTPRNKPYHFNPKNLAARLRGYRDCTSVVPSTLSTANAYWWLRDSMWSLAAADQSRDIRFGSAVYDDLDRYVSRVAGGAGGPVGVDYRVFHLWYEHKRSIMRRLTFVAGLAGDSAELSSLLAGWRGLVRDVDILRLGILHQVMARRPGLPAHTGTVLREIRKAEADLLAGICDQLDTVS